MAPGPAQNVELGLLRVDRHGRAVERPHFDACLATARHFSASPLWVDSLHPTWSPSHEVHVWSMCSLDSIIINGMNPACLLHRILHSLSLVSCLLGRTFLRRGVFARTLAAAVWDQLVRDASGLST